MAQPALQPKFRRGRCRPPPSPYAADENACIRACMSGSFLVARRQQSQFEAPAAEQGVTADEERIRPAPSPDVQRLIDLADRAGVEHLDLQTDGTSRSFRVAQRGLGIPGIIGIGPARQPARPGFSAVPPAVTLLPAPMFHAGFQPSCDDTAGIRTELRVAEIGERHVHVGPCAANETADVAT